MYTLPIVQGACRMGLAVYIIVYHNICTVQYVYKHIENNRICINWTPKQVEWTHPIRNELYVEGLKRLKNAVHNEWLGNCQDDQN